MSRFVQGADRRQPTLLPECLDDYVDEDNPVRVVDVFVDELDLKGLAFEGMTPATTGRPAYHPAMLLKLYIHGYLNKVQSSRCLEREAQRNVELMWLMGRLAQRRMAESTRREWTRRLDRIVEHFGELRVAQFDRPDKIRPVIRRWRDQWADRPREADYVIQVLSRVLTHAVDLDKISANPCEGIKSLYSNSRADIIWTDEDLAAFKAVAPTEVWWVVNLAACTGLRAGDLKRLAWSHIGPDAIEIPTDKSRGLRAAFVPLYDDLKAALAEVERRRPLVLTNTLGRPWKAGVNGSSFEKVRDLALPGRDLHFHDLRGTAATRFHLAGLSNRDIAEIMAWDEASVEKIIRRYVGRKAVTAGIIKRLNQTEGRT